MTAPTTSTAPLVKAWESAITAEGDITRGEFYRADHPMVRAHPQFFVDAGTPESEMPSFIDVIVERNAEQDRAAAQEKRERFEAAAKENPVKLEVPTLVRLTRDVFDHIDGKPALVKKGSVVLAHDRLTQEHPDAWEPVKP